MKEEIFKPELYPQKERINEELREKAEEFLKIYFQNEEKLEQINWEIGSEEGFIPVITKEILPKTPQLAKEDLQDFLNIVLEKIEETKQGYSHYIFGYFLSLFINHQVDLYIENQTRNNISREQIKPIEITLDLTNLSERLDCVGHKNREAVSLNIIGNVGDFAGDYMMGGTVRIKGDAGDDAGFAMQGGTLVIDGHVGNDAGAWMDSGIMKLSIEPHDFEHGHGFRNNKGEIWVKNKRIWPIE